MASRSTIAFWSSVGAYRYFPSMSAMKPSRHSCSKCSAASAFCTYKRCAISSSCQSRLSFERNRRRASSCAMESMCRRMKFSISLSMCCNWLLPRTSNAEQSTGITCPQRRWRALPKKSAPCPCTNGAALNELRHSGSYADLQSGHGNHSDRTELSLKSLPSHVPFPRLRIQTL